MLWQFSLALMVRQFKFSSCHLSTPVYFSAVSARKLCKTVRPTLKDFHKTVGDLYVSMQGRKCIDMEAFNKAAADHDAALVRLGLNDRQAGQWYVAVRAFRDELVSDDRRSKGGRKRLNKKKDAFIKAADIFLSSQQGLEDFLTNEAKKNDPFLAEIYELYDGYVKTANRLVDEPEFVYEFFSREYAIYLAMFCVAQGKVLDRVNAQKAAAAAV